jgi:Rps23 Pro-64 3,4-dihydroxylase Tpa1-like proline 4-hydroxylase
MEFVNEEVIKNAIYESTPFPHTILDDFLQKDKLENILFHINNLKDKDAQSQFTNPYSSCEFNKYAFSENYGEYIKNLFTELNSSGFIQHLEKLTGIKGLITNDIRLQGAGIHRIKRGGFLQLHTDFNSYYNEYGKLDRRINLLIYMNPDWKEEYNGSLCLCDKETQTCIKKISPLMNRCVIFNTSNKSIHGHPEILKTPDNISRQSIAVYYYTRNTNGMTDFEGDNEHSTVWYPNIKV